MWRALDFGRYPDLVCRKGENGVVEVLSWHDLDFWTTLHSLVRERKLFLAWGGDLAMEMDGRIAVSY